MPGALGEHGFGQAVPARLAGAAAVEDAGKIVVPRGLRLMGDAEYDVGQVVGRCRAAALVGDHAEMVARFGQP